MTRIVQVVPFMSAGSGVAGVAWNLDRELRRLGADVEAYTFPDMRRGKGDVIRMRGRKTARIVTSWRVVWMSTVGTRRTRAYLAAQPDAVSIVHSNVTIGDVYVNHGVLFAAMRARGRAGLRLLIDPARVYVHFRDRARYRGHAHRRIVALTKAEVQTLRNSYGRIGMPVAVISNGVDLDAYRPPSPAERAEARELFRLDDEDRVALFIGHEFDRKGLPTAIEALAHAPTVLLLVIGGNAKMVADAQQLAEKHGVADRVMLLGQQTGVQKYLAAADMFVLPSVYESSGLVFLEALASGLPVVATRVGVAPEVVVDGVNGYLVDREPVEIADRLERIAAQLPGTYAVAARESVEGYSWAAIAQQYLDLANEIAAEKAAESAASARRA
ncbi:glycosyltransferase [Microbacterium sp. ASV49]|uniref:Glycosyltransferase n=1 Tax=Microbacterium candidum TaxID=3041922 RepID=A0ABT7MUZ5_9MICO|nr:glycosyltransferase [Microbacterium sp. ASV49]MDL9978282.1 glycosyltransferase [Microbacterium sp. ASV49]